MLFYLSPRVTLYPHVVDCSHIYNTFIVLTTDKPQLFMVVVLFHHIFCQKYGRTLRLRHLPTQR